QYRRCAVALDAAGDTPRFDDERLGARGRTADRARELNAAFEARHAALDPDRDVGFGGQRLVDRVDRRGRLGAAVLRHAAGGGGEGIGITLAGDDEGAIAFARPRQRAQLARELQLLEHEMAVVGGVGETGTAVLDVQPRDRNRLQTEAEFGDRPSQAAGAVEPGREFGAFQVGVGNAPFAARPRAQREFYSPYAPA